MRFATRVRMIVKHAPMRKVYTSISALVTGGPAFGIPCGRLSPMDDSESGESYDDWANNPAGEPSGSPMTLENIREKVQVGIDKLDRGKYMTNIRANLF
jgi:hypothetical protein